MNKYLVKIRVCSETEWKSWEREELIYAQNVDKVKEIIKQQEKESIIDSYYIDQITLIKETA